MNRPVLGAAVLGALAAAGPVQEPTLEVGTATERVLSAGQSHAYQIACPAGSYVYAVVDQGGVDLVVTVTGPDGAEVIEVDTPTEPSGREGAETVPFVAERAGAYRLAVRALQAKAEGAYAVRVEQRRAATAADRTRFEARRLWTEAQRTLGRDSAEAPAKALEMFERSSRWLEQVGESYDAARVLNVAAYLANSLDEIDRSFAGYERVLSLAVAARARRYEGLAHAGLGVAERKRDAPDRARAHYQQALEIFRSLGDERGISSALLGLGVVQWEDLGDAAQALPLLTEALARSRSGEDRIQEYTALHNIASIHDWSGEKQQALESYQRVIELVRTLGDRVATVYTLNELGHLYTQWGDHARARDAHVEALDLVRRAGNRLHETWTLLHLGRLHSLQGETASALDSLQAALKVSREIGDTTLEAHALSRLGELYGGQGDTGRALEHLRAAAGIYRRSRLKYWPGLAYVQLGKICLQAGDRSGARAALAEALESARSSNVPGLEAAARRELARVALEEGDAEAASREAAAALAIVESQRVRIPRPDLRTTYFASVHPYYQTQITALMARHEEQPQAGHAASALHVSERARARRVLDALAESAIEARSTADPGLVQRERTLRQQMSALALRQQQLAETQAPAGRQASVDKRLRELEAEHQDVMMRARQGRSRHAALMEPSVLQLPEIQQELEPGTALVEYALGEERSYVWVVTRSSLVARELPREATLEAVARRLYAASSARAEEGPGLSGRLAAADRTAARAAAELGRLILPDDLVGLGAQRLVIVADGALRVVPFAALPLPRPGTPRTLASEFELAYAPSASWVAALRRLREGVSPPTKTLAVFADPVFSRLDSRVAARQGEPPALEARLRSAVADIGLADPDGELMRLPLSRREAQKAASLAGASEALVALDFEASRERATSPELAEFRIVHFATHSLLNNEHPDLSGVVLSLFDRNGRPQDGFLRVQDIYNLRLRAELVVLSACQTAIGKSVPGEGLMGLARSFMYAGAPRVVASLWPVDESATTELMTLFYRELLREKRAAPEALRRAQLTLAAKPRWREPYFWAGFVVQGDWR